jgi:hypothetical protein
MRKNKKQEVTIEINPKTLNVIQARGYQNRATDFEENVVLAQWLNHVREQVVASATKNLEPSTSRF